MCVCVCVSVFVSVCACVRVCVHVETLLLYFQESDSVTNRVAGFICKYVLSEHLSCVTSLIIVGREHNQDTTFVVSDQWSWWSLQWSLCSLCAE